MVTSEFRHDGPWAVAHASRYAEFYDIGLGREPLERVWIEAARPKRIAATVKKALGERLFPIVVAADRRAVKACVDALRPGAPLIAFWGTLDRDEGEQELLASRRSLFAGARIAPIGAVRTSGRLAIRSGGHLSLDLDVLAPCVLRHNRSIEPGGLSWDSLCGLLDEVFAGHRPGSASLVGCRGIPMDSPAALLACQVLFRLAAAAGGRTKRS